MANINMKKAVIYNDGAYKALLGFAAAFVLCTVIYVTVMCFTQYDAFLKIAQAR